MTFTLIMNWTDDIGISPINILCEVLVHDVKEIRVHLLNLIKIVRKLYPLRQLLMRHVSESVDCELRSGIGL